MVFNTDVMQTSFRDLLYVVFRYKFHIALFFIIVVTGVTAYTYLTEELYRSDARLYIRVGRESVSLDPSVTGQTMPIFADRDNEIKSELAILTSEALIDEVIEDYGDAKVLRKDENVSIFKKTIRSVKNVVFKTIRGVMITLDLAEPMTEHERAVAKAIENLNLEIEKSSNIINVQYDAQDPETAQGILNNIIKKYISEHIKVHASQASLDFIDGEAQKLKAILDTAEIAFDDFRKEHKIVALEDQKAAVLERIVALEGEVDEVASLAEASAARVASLENSLTDRQKVRELNRIEGRTNSAADTLKDRLSELKMQELDLSLRYPDTHRPLIEVREKLARIEAALANEEETRTEVTIGIDAGYQDLETALENERAQLGAHRASLAVLTRELEKEKVILEAYTQRELKYTQLARNVELAEKEYRSYRENLEQARISKALDVEEVSNVRVIQPPTMPIEPNSPDKPLNIGLGILLGLFGGLFYAFVLDYLDDTLNTQEKAERRLGTRVLAVVSDKEFKKCT